MPDRTSGLILGPNGEPMKVPTIIFDAEDARLLRKYKRLLEKYGLKEALYCDSCWGQNLSHGLEAEVTDQRIIMKCRCQLRFFQGPTY